MFVSFTPELSPRGSLLQCPHTVINVLTLWLPPGLGRSLAPTLQVGMISNHEIWAWFLWSPRGNASQEQGSQPSLSHHHCRCCQNQLQVIQKSCMEPVTTPGHTSLLLVHWPRTFSGEKVLYFGAFIQEIACVPVLLLHKILPITLS